jgi:chromate transporter
VIGVMVQLAGVFAWHTLWPSGQWGQTDWPALLLTVLAAWLLIGRQWAVVRVLVVCVVVGMAMQWA